MELMRAAALPKPVRQSNVVVLAAGRDPRPALPRARAGRPLRLPHGMVRVVVLDRETGESFTEDIGDDNAVAIYIPGTLAHGYEALTRLPLPVPRHRGVRRRRSRRAWPALERRARQEPLEHRAADPLGARLRRVLVTGGGGQLGTALAEQFPDAQVLTREDWDVTHPAPARWRTVTSTSFCTPRPGPTSTAPRTIRKVRLP